MFIKLKCYEVDVWINIDQISEVERFGFYSKFYMSNGNEYEVSTEDSHERLMDAIGAING